MNSKGFPYMIHYKLAHTIKLPVGPKQVPKSSLFHPKLLIGWDVLSICFLFLSTVKKVALFLDLF